MVKNNKNSDEKLSEIYYKPENLWTGQKAIRKLYEITKFPKKKIKSWLAKQVLWQVHIPAPKTIDRPHYQVTIPNQLHQFDLLYMPHDVVYSTTYKYILTGIDVASRYKIARPLRTKKASDVAFLLKTIYGNKKIPLDYPVEFQCDNGSEFKSEVTKLLETHDVEIRRATTKYRHTFTAFVENFNKILAEKLFKIQDAQELNNPTKDSKTWVKHLYTIVDELNKESNSVIKIAPQKAIELKEVQLFHEPYPKEDILPTDGLYRYLYQPGELEGGQQRRATDMIWSWNTFRLDRIIEDPGQRVLYYITNDKAPERAFVREELMLIPEDSQLPPDHVKEW